MKKRAFRIFTIILLVLSVLMTAGGVVSSASFGSGARVVAAKVNMVKTGLSGRRICFSDADFKSAVCLTDFDGIKITEIPSSTEGSLLLAGRRVGKGKVVKRENIGSLCFMPATSSLKECSFKFIIDGYAMSEEIECILKFTDKINYEPKAENESSGLITQSGVSLYGKLFGNDPEGDKLSFIVVSYPKEGVLELVDESGGGFIYTPSGDYKGEDKFTYVVRDEYGNYSEPCRVSVTVQERMTDVVYTDMKNRSEYNAALAMTAMNVMGGKLVGDDIYFMPDETVSRAEFVAMAMKCAGMRADSTLTASYFDDDEDISPSLRSYVATAQRVGIINGDFHDGGLYFAPNDPICGYDAAKIMAAVLGASEGGEELVFADEEIPVSARAGITAMLTMGVFNEDDVSVAGDNLTRASAASYLYRLTNIIK